MRGGRRGDAARCAQGCGWPVGRVTHSAAGCPAPPTPLCRDTRVATQNCDVWRLLSGSAQVRENGGEGGPTILLLLS